MRKLFCLVFFSMLLFQLRAQSSFADKCIGSWQGRMYMFKEGKILDSVEINFTVATTTDSNTWIWKMEYSSPKFKSVKDYLLKLKDKDKNLYVIDEKDGVELNAYLFDNSLQSVFETEGIMLTSAYTITDNNLVFSVGSGKKIADVKTSVTNYSVTHFQKVILHKKK